MGILDVFGKIDNVLDDVLDVAVKAAAKGSVVTPAPKPTVKQQIDNALDALSGVNRDVTTDKIFLDIDNARATLNKMRGSVEEMRQQRKGMDDVYWLSERSWLGLSGDAVRERLVEAAKAQEKMILDLETDIGAMESTIQEFIDADATLAGMMKSRQA